MTIQPGSAWGEPGVLPAGAPIADSDETLGEVVVELMAAASADGSGADRLPLGPVGITGGSLWRTMGAPRGGAQRLASAALVAPVDIARVELDGSETWFVSHLVARRSWWRGEILVLMNAEFLGDWDVATKGHPNDGRLDLYRGDLSIGDRWKARQRLPTGVHVPHPGIEARRVQTLSEHFTRPTDVYIDGVRHRGVRELNVTVIQDALVVTA